MRLKWWYMADNERYNTRLLLDTEWEVKQCRARQRKTWMKIINEFLLEFNIRR